MTNRPLGRCFLTVGDDSIVARIASSQLSGRSFGSFIAKKNVSFASFLTLRKEGAGSPQENNLYIDNISNVIYNESIWVQQNTYTTSAH